MSQPIIRTSDMRKKMGDTTTESAVFGLPQSQGQAKPLRVSKEKKDK